MNCPSCRTEMKPLFTGSFCPGDCDRSGKKIVGVSGGFVWKGKTWSWEWIPKGEWPDEPGDWRAWAVADMHGTPLEILESQIRDFAPVNWFDEPGCGSGLHYTKKGQGNNFPGFIFRKP